MLRGVPTKYLEMLPYFLLSPNPDIYLSDNFVVFDLETSCRGHGGSPMPCWDENTIVDASWVTPDGEQHNIYGNEYEMAPLVDALEAADFIVAHNGKFDLGWMKRAGIDLRKLVLYDTMIGEYVRLGNRKGPLSLDALAKEHLGVGKRHFIAICMGRVCPSDMPVSKLVTRADEDVVMTRDLFLLQRDVLHDMGLLPCVYTRCLLSPALADIESNGCCVDGELVEKMYSESITKLADATLEMDEFTEGRNPKSPKQMQEFIYDVLKFKAPTKGRGKNKEEHRTTKTEDVMRFKATTKKQRKFIELKKEFARHNADVGKTLQYFHGVATDPDRPGGLFYAQFNQCVTVTHRLSSTGIKREFSHMLDAKGKPIAKSVQFQNLGRHFKPLIKARKEGWLMAEADGSQLEFRVAAFLGGCRVACQAIVDGVDVHTDTANTLTEHGQPTTRQEAKASTFKPLYGGQSGTEAEQEYYKWFRSHYEGIGATQQGWKDEAVVNKTVVLPHGFVFHFPNASLRRDGYVTDSTNICNYPVQHFATAEIIPIAIVYLWHMMQDMESFLVNTVHDSVISELHPDEQEEFKERSLCAFTHLVYHYLKEVYGVEFNVPLGIGVKIGTNWGTGHEVKCAPMPPFEMEGVTYDNLVTEWEDD